MNQNINSTQRSTVLITGASSGIGEALAREYAQRGAHLLLLGRRKDRLDALAAELMERHRHSIKVITACCDVTEDGAIENAIAQAQPEIGPIHTVIANAGFGVVGRVDELKLDDYRRQFETNVFGVLRTIYATLPELKKNRGRIALIGSLSGHVNLPVTSAYSMSKFAVRSLAECLHAELKDEGVSVTLISPGFIQSEIRQVNNEGRHQSQSPKGWSRLHMPAAKAARLIADAIDERRRERLITWYAVLIVYLHRLCPGAFRLLLKLAGIKARSQPH